MKRIAKRSPNNIIGLLLISLGFLTGIWGKILIAPPLDVLLGMFILGAGCGLIIHHLLSKRYIIAEKFEHNLIKKHETLFERSLEILPGALTWTALTSPFWLSFTLPFAVAYLIILADVYWLTSALRIAILILFGHHQMERAKNEDWLKKLQQDFPHQWQQYYHLILLPTYKEPLEVLAPAYNAVINSTYPKDKIIMVVGFESRDDPDKITQTKKYLQKIEKKIKAIYTTIHPYGLPGEAPGQGSNKNWMINQVLSQLKERGIDPQDVLVTTLDADFVIHPQFLAGALHKYLATPQNERDQRTYTGVFLYYNNYWQAPTPMRLIATGTAFWQLAEMVGSDKYQNFSSLSINLKSLLAIGLWIPNKVNDDSGFYWKAYFHFGGNYKVIPHFLPISGDATLDVTLLKSFQNQYLQLKRWAYGVEHIPFVFKEYFRRVDIDFWDKTDKLLFVVWANLKWGMLALFVTFAGLVIPYINPQYSQSVVAVNLPIISSWILTAAFVGLFATVYVHERTVPPRPAHWSIINRIWSYLQFILIPIVLVTISTIPAIDAQTSLMFGRYLEFRVTRKARLTSS